MDDKKTYDLKYPITVTLTQGGQSREETISQLSFRRLTVADLRATSKIGNEEERGLQLLRRAADLPEAAFDKLDLTDMLAAQEVIADFFPKSPITGETFSPPSL